MKRGWRWLGGIGIVVCLAVSASGVFVVTRRAGLQRKVETLHEIDNTRRSGARLPVRGHGASGNAWDHYAAAGRLRGLPESEFPIPSIDDLDRGAPEAPGPRAGLVADAIRTGAESGACSPRTPAKEFSSYWQTADCVGWLAVCAEQDGRLDAAVDRYLDELWFCLDVVASGQDAWQWAALQRAEWVLHRLGMLLARDAEAMPSARQALARADRGYPSIAPALAVAAAWEGERALAGDGMFLSSRLPGPLQRINEQALRLVSIVQTSYVTDDRLVRIGLDGRPWSFVRPRLVELVQHVDPMQACGLGDRASLRARAWAAWITRSRVVLAKLRLLRAALGEPVAILADPLGPPGATLQCRHEPDRDVLWSLGPDGIDDRGRCPAGVAGPVPALDRNRAPTWAQRLAIFRLRGDLVFVLPRQP